MNRTLFRWMMCGALYASSLGIVPGSTALTSTLEAQNPPQPAIVISIGSVDKQLDDANYLLAAAGFPEMKFIVQTMIKQYSQGISPTKPAGVFFYWKDGAQEPEFWAAVPVTNLDSMLDVVAGFADVQDEDGGAVIELPDGTDLFVKERSGVAYMALDKSIFDNLSDDYVAELGDLPTRYNMAARIFAGRIPDSLRQMAVEQIQDAYDQQMQMMGENTLQEGLQDYQLQQLEMLLNETDSILFGFNPDQEAKKLVFDFEMTALPGSEMAQRFLDSKADFANSLVKGFLMKNAAMSFAGIANMNPADTQQMNQMLESLPEMVRDELEFEDLSDKEFDQISKFVEGLKRVLSDTISEGKIDAAASMITDKESMNFIGGIRVANPKKLENLVKDMVPMITEKVGDKLEIKLNSGTHRDVTFHQFMLDAPDEMLELFGDQIEIAVGIGNQVVYFGMGTSPQAAIKQAMDDPGPSQSQPASQINLRLGQILELVSRFENEPMLRQIVNKLEKDGGDEIRITSEYIENGTVSRMEIQDGILSLIKVAVDSFSGMGGDFGDDF